MARYCTYLSTHPTGFWYAGKGQTAKVEAGTYRGSGVKLNVTFRNPAYSFNTWTTIVLETFESEDDAYEAEARLVTHDALLDPFCLNMTLGGKKGKYQDHSALLRRLKAADKKRKTTEDRLLKTQRAAKARLTRLTRK